MLFPQAGGTGPWLSSSRYWSLIEHTELLPQLFSGKLHSQALKRLDVFFTFLVRAHKLSLDDVRQVWANCAATDRHESELQTAYERIVGILRDAKAVQAENFTALTASAVAAANAEAEAAVIAAAAVSSTEAGPSSESDVIDVTSVSEQPLEPAVAAAEELLGSRKAPVPAEVTAASLVDCPDYSGLMLQLIVERYLPLPHSQLPHKLPRSFLSLLNGVIFNSLSDHKYVSVATSTLVGSD